MADGTWIVSVMVGRDIFRGTRLTGLLWLDAGLELAYCIESAGQHDASIDLGQHVAQV